MGDASASDPCRRFLNVECRVDRIVRDTHGFIIREVEHKPIRDLFDRLAKDEKRPESDRRTLALRADRIRERLFQRPRSRRAPGRVIFYGVQRTSEVNTELGGAAFREALWACVPVR